jgi:hypothetical protein
LYHFTFSQSILGKWEELTVACVTWNLSESLPKMSDIRYCNFIAKMTFPDFFVVFAHATL